MQVGPHAAEVSWCCSLLPNSTPVNFVHQETVQHSCGNVSVESFSVARDGANGGACVLLMNESVGDL